MTTVQVQVRIPEKMVRELDRWISDGAFSSRSDAVKTIVTLHIERERIRKFYQVLAKRSEDAEKNPGVLIPLEEAT